MPETIVSRVSGSDATRNVGSSSERRESAIPIFSWSTFVFGSMRIDTTGSGNTIASKAMGCSSSQSVWPILISFKPTAAAISPAYTSFRSSRLSACNRTMRPRRSFRRVVALYIKSPALMTPEYTRKNDKAPTNGSTCNLKTSAAKGASSLDDRVSSSPVSGFVPFAGGKSRGLGR